MRNNVYLGIDASTFSKLFRFEAESDKPYSATEMLNELRKGIWSELTLRKPIDIYRRSLQKSFVESLNRIISPETGSSFILTPSGFSAAMPTSKTSDALSISKAQLRVLAAEIRAALPGYKDAASRAHLQDVLDRIDETLKPAKN